MGHCRESRYRQGAKRLIGRSPYRLHPRQIAELTQLPGVGGPGGGDLVSRTDQNTHGLEHGRDKKRIAIERSVVNPIHMGIDQIVKDPSIQPASSGQVCQPLQNRVPLSRRAGEDAVQLIGPPGEPHLGQDGLTDPRRDRREFRLESIESGQVRPLAFGRPQTA